MKNKTITYFAVVIAGLLLNGCANIYLRKGDQQFNNLAYGNALKFYEKALGKEFNAEQQQHLADCYRHLNDYKKAEGAYKKAVNMPGAKVETHFYLGKVLMANGNYPEAEAELKKYSELVPESELTASLQNSCSKIRELKSDSELFKIIPVSIPGFSVAFSPVPYKTGIVFTSFQDDKTGKKDPWTGRTFYNLFFTEQSEDSCWTDPYPLNGDLNKDYHEGAAAFDKEGKTVYFTRSNYYRNELKKNSQNESNLKIFRAELVNGRWTKLFELPFNSDDYSCGQPSLSADDKTLYFISDMPGGKGGTDIYSCNVLGNGFTKPQNLGDSINTSGDEMFPYYNSDDSILYFSSEGHMNLGGLDIFKTKFINSVWTKPENLGYPVNSSKDDFSYVPFPGNKSAYFSSNRDSLDYIYRVDKVDPIFNLSGIVTSTADSKPIANTKIKIKNSTGLFNDSLQTDSLGKYSLRISQNSLFNLSVSHEDYKPASGVLNVPEKKHSEDFTMNFELDEIIPVFTLKGIVSIKGKGAPIANSRIRIKSNGVYLKTLITDSLGKYEIEVTPTLKYSLNATKDGYFTANDLIEIPERKRSETFTKNLELEEIILEKPIVMDNIYYDLNKTAIRPDAAIELNKLVKLLNENPGITIELGSHTDSRASDPYNLKLSQKRAESAVKYIISKGIKSTRIIAKGYGETKLLNNCGNGVICPEDEHQKNRRTEFKVLKINSRDNIVASKK